MEKRKKDTKQVFFYFGDSFITIISPYNYNLSQTGFQWNDNKEKKKKFPQDEYRFFFFFLY